MNPSRVRNLLIVAVVATTTGLLAHGGGRKSRLTPPAGAELQDARGEVKIKTDELELKVRGLEADTDYGVFLEDGDGVLVEIGTIGTEDDGKGELEFESDDDDDDLPLPLGAMTSDQLAGRAIEIRDGDGNVVLAGTTPDIRFREKRDACS